MINNIETLQKRDLRPQRKDKAVSQNLKINQTVGDPTNETSEGINTSLPHFSQYDWLHRLHVKSCLSTSKYI